MRFLLGFIVLFLLLTGLFCGGGLYYGLSTWRNPGPNAIVKDIIIARGSGVSTIADQLYNEGIISSPLVFKIGARIGGTQSQLKAGEYEFPPGIAMHEVIDKLARGDVIDRKVTIAEGLTSWQIIQIVNRAPAMAGTVAEIPKDGTLLPETYTYTRDQDRNSVIRAMQDSMAKTLTELWATRAEGLPFDTPEKAMTLASIVEKETGMASERPRIAGVFINRLKAGMPLQSDPTVIYAMTSGQVKDEGQGPLGRRLLRADLENTDSPYNTYKYPGLPPGPIANPGRAAIEAVLHPEQNDFIYFVAKGDGGHVFAASLAEHEKNAAQWRQIRKEQGN